jgi:hypothetical protein
MDPGTDLASTCFGVDSGGQWPGVHEVTGRKAELRLLRYPSESIDVKMELGCPNLFKTVDYPPLVTGDLEVGKPETTRIKSRRLAISSTKWRNIASLTMSDCVKSF